MNLQQTSTDGPGLTYVVHFAEVALKGKNRPEFMKLLRRNISNSLIGLDPVVRHADGRFLVTAKGDGKELESRLSKVFGVAWYARAAVVSRDYQSISEAVLSEASSERGATFRIHARRSDKAFPMTSQELASKLGAEVAASSGMKVDLSDPQVTIHADIAASMAFVYSSKHRGLGGLPVGCAGRVIHLFSGGIDSPPAAWLLMKRGARPVYLHFYLAPTPQYAIDSKVSRLVRILSEYGGKSTLVLVPFAEYQASTLDAPGDFEPSLFRRFMRMAAEKVAPIFGASAVSTGDSLSQAASQTIWNMAAFDRGSTLPILRPLLTYDKEEVISLAKSIGTYEASLEEYRDCCAIVTKHPRTRTSPDSIDRLAKQFEFDALAERALGAGTVVAHDPTDGATKVIPLAEIISKRAGHESDEESPVVASPLGDP